MRLCLLLIPLIAAFPFDCAIPPDDHVIPPQDYTMVERHASFFQGSNWNTNYICYDDFVDAMGRLGIGVKRYFVAFMIMWKAGQTTNLVETSMWEVFGPMSIYRPSLLKIVHPPADMGVFQRDGSAIVANFPDIADDNGYITQERIFAYIQQRNNNVPPTDLQRGEFELLFEVLGYHYDQHLRDTPYLTHDDVIALYDGSLFYRLTNTTPPWEL